MDELQRARARQRVAAREGFDWTDVAGMWPKLDEEIAELKSARNGAERREELGDVLFMVVNIARHLGVDPVLALAEATAKFDRRFACVMDTDQLPALGDSRRLVAMEVRWQLAKQKEKSPASD